MKKRDFYLILISIICLTSCSKHDSKFGIEKNVSISGKIIGFEKDKSPNTLQIIRRDFFDKNENYISTIDENGHFKLSFPIIYPQEIYLEYGNFFSLVLRPNDSLYIAIENKFAERYDLNYVHFDNTEIGKTNLLVNKYYEELPLEEYFYQRAIDAEKNMNPKEYTGFIHERDSALTALYNKFISENATTPLFKKWCLDDIKYLALKSLMRYRWTHPDHNNIDSFSLPENYFSFLTDYNMNDNNVFSFNHSDFLHEFFMYSYYTPKDSFQKASNLPRDKGYEVIKNMLKMHSTGFTRELFLSINYMNILDGQLLDVFESTYDSSFTDQNYFLTTIDDEYQKLKEYLSNQNTGAINVSTIESSIVAGLLDTIAQRYHDKVIYIDFWAPWCSPCMNEMPYSKEIQEYYKDNDVIFVFLANRCKEDSWKATIANKKLTGEHFLLTNDQYNVLAGILDISGIPQYTLIDRNGNIVLKNAPRPSDKDNLIKEINRQLNK